MVDPCGPPDLWTGPIDPSLNTDVPYDPSYDAGLLDLEPALPTGRSTSGGESHLLYDATVVAVDTGKNYFDRIIVADANFSIAVVLNKSETASVGDTVDFATSWLGGRSGSSYVERTSGWTVLSSANPMYVAELGSANVDYYARRNQLVHVYGEITARSSHECEIWALDCYVLEHDGTEDYIRVPRDNPWYLDIDYEGGLCAEIVAPVNIYMGSTGTVEFLDITNTDWMRTWEGSP